MATESQISSAEPASLIRRPVLVACAAGLCWAGVFAILLSAQFEAAGGALTPVRVMFYLLTLLAGLLTFVPIQRHIQTPGLAFEGVVGVVLLVYALTFMPPPTGSLLALPDLPVYVVFLMALFWTCAAIVLPIIYGLGQRLFQRRARRYDLRRARRQAHECSAVVVLCAALAGLRVLTPLYVVLVILIVIVAEMLFLAFIETSV